MLSLEGEGASSAICYGVDYRSHTNVAIKIIKYNALTGKQLTVLQREIYVLATTAHPYLIEFVGATHTLPYCIIAEWMPGSTLFNSLQYTSFDVTDRLIAAYDIASVDGISPFTIHCSPRPQVAESAL
jgi:serine/threonine protein kinase